MTPRRAIYVLLLGWLPVATTCADEEPIVNAYEVAPLVTLAGALRDGAPAALEARGIRTVIDLREPWEISSLAVERLVELGFEYINFPTTGEAPSAERLEAFTAMLDARAGEPILLHCASGNRAGMMWGLYRLERGASLETVLAEVRPVVTRDALADVLRGHAKGPSKN